MAQIWDALLTLDPILDYDHVDKDGNQDTVTRCCGWAPSMGRRCRNMIQSHSRLEVTTEIRKFGFILPQASGFAEILEKLLPSTVCYLHRVQLPGKLKECLAAIRKVALDRETKEWADMITNASTESLPFESSEDEDDCDQDSISSFSTEDVETNAIMAYPSPPPTPPHTRIRGPIMKTAVTSSLRNGSPLLPIKPSNDTTRINLEPHTNQRQSALRRRQTTNLSIMAAQTIYSYCGDDTPAVNSPVRPPPALSSRLEERPDQPSSNIDEPPASQPTPNTTLTLETQDDIITYDLSPSAEDAAIPDKKIESSPIETVSLSTLAPGLNEISSDTFVPLVLAYGYTIIVVAVVGFELLWALPRSMFNV